MSILNVLVICDDGATMLNPYMPLWSHLKTSDDVNLKIHRFNLMTGRARMFDLYSDAMHLSQFHMPDMRIKFDHAFIIIPKVKIAEKKLIDMIEFFSTFYVKNRGIIHLFMVEDFSDKSFTLVKRIPASYINFDYKILSPPKYWINYYKSVVSALDDVYKHPLIKTPAIPFGTNSVYEYELPPTLHNPENNADINNLNAYMIMIFRMSDVINTLYSYREAVRARSEPFAPFVNLVLDMYESRGMNIEYGNADTLDLLDKTVFSSSNKLKYILNALNQMSRICAPTPLNLSYVMTRTKFNKIDLEKLKIPTNAFELNDLELTDIQYEQRLTQAKLLKDAVNSTKEQTTAQADIVYLKLFTDFDRANQTLQSHLEKTCADKVVAHLIAGNELSRHFISNNDLISEYIYDQFTVNKYIIVILKSMLANVWKFSYKNKSMFLHVPGSNKLHELVLFLAKYKHTSEYITVLRANYDGWDIIKKQHRGQVTTDVLQNYIDNNIILPAIFVYEEVDRHSEKYKHKMDTERRYDVVWDMYKEHERVRAARARKPVPAPSPAPPTPVIVPAPFPAPPTPVIVPAPFPAPPTPVIVPAPSPAPPTPVIVPAPFPAPPTPMIVPAPFPAPPTPMIVPAPFPAPPTPAPPAPMFVPAPPEPVFATEPPEPVFATEPPKSPAPRKKSRSRSRSRSRPKRVSKSPKKVKKVKKVEKRKASKKSSRKKKDSDDSLEKLMKSMGLYPRGGTRR